MTDLLHASLLAFALTCAVIEITPGPNMGYLAALAVARGWLAWQGWFEADDIAPDAADGHDGALGTAFRRGFVTNLLNPKAGILRRALGAIAIWFAFSTMR